MEVTIFGFSQNDVLKAEKIEYRRFKFSAGEVQIRLPPLNAYQRVIIESRYPDSDDLVTVTLILNALHSMRFSGHVTVQLPYLPYSRQDRPCFAGEAFSLRAILQILKIGFKDSYKLITWDVHSRVASEQFGPMLHNVTADVLIKRFDPSVLDAESFPIPNKENYVVLAPDKGAVERTKLVAKAIGLSSITYAIKERNSDDGQITGVKIDNPEILKGKKVLIVDDICDGGRTFVELSRVIRREDPASIYLYVTHGIFSKGLEVFSMDGNLLIDRVITPNLFPGVDISDSLDYPNVYTL